MDATSESDDSAEASGTPEDTVADTGLTINPVTSPTNVTPQTISGNKESDTSIWINGTEQVVLNSATSWDWEMPLSEGSNSISVTSKDEAGNESGAVTATITMDTAAPAKPTLNLVTSPTNVTPQTISGNKEADTSIRIDGSEVVALNSATTWSWDIPLSEGDNSFSVTSKDAAGNESEAVAAAITLETVPPANVTGFTAASGNGQVTLDWTNPVDSDFSGVVVCRDATSTVDFTCAGGVEVFNQTGTAGAVQGFTEGSLPNGNTYTYSVFTYDFVGNHSGGVTANVRPSILSSPTEVSAGNFFTCALDSTSVVCWGSDTAGQVSGMPALSTPTQVSAGGGGVGSGGHACALDSSGVVCWGQDDNGQVSGIPALSSPTQVVAGGWHSCALDANGVVCWGLANPPALFAPTQVSAGESNSCAIDSTGVVCWGSDSFGQVSGIPALSSPTQVSVGGAHICALDSSGVVCWGHDDLGQVSGMPALFTPTQVSAGRLHTCALDSTGVVCWGYDGGGRVSGIPALSTPAQVTAGAWDTCALDSIGVFCWGENSYGENNVP